MAYMTARDTGLGQWETIASILGSVTKAGASIYGATQAAGAATAQAKAAETAAKTQLEAAKLAAQTSAAQIEAQSAQWATIEKLAIPLGIAAFGGLALWIMMKRRKK